MAAKKDVDARAKRGHDDQFGETISSKTRFTPLQKPVKHFISYNER